MNVMPSSASENSARRNACRLGIGRDGEMAPTMPKPEAMLPKAGAHFAAPLWIV
jgi:hypothetical protein